MSGDGEIEMRRVTVSFSVDIDMTELNEAKAKMEALRPATVECAVAFDRLKAMKTYIMGRLEGECQAYMNIAKSELKEIYGL